VPYAPFAIIVQSILIIGIGIAMFWNIVLASTSGLDSVWRIVLSGSVLGDGIACIHPVGVHINGCGEI
jgi:hypothetical protein